MKITYDDRDFKNKTNKFVEQVAGDRRQKAVHDVASEILRLSQREVPHDVGTLQNSGFVKDEIDESIVGYNTRYAARLHEHPEYRFGKGRKGKYLEDPIKTNLMVFKKYFEDMFKK